MELAELLREAGYRYTTVTPATHKRVNAHGPAVSRNLADIFGWSRPFPESAVPRAMFALMRRADLLARDGNLWRSTLRASTLGEHLYFHSAYPTNEADAVFFGPDTYRFLRALRDNLPGTCMRAADIGCGSGAAAIALGLHYPAAQVIAIDINEAALRLTKVNAAIAGAPNLQALRSNLLDAVEGSFDLIVSNPPYLLDADERAYRHGGGDLGTGLSLAIVETALRRLAPGGRLLLYTGVAIVNGIDPFAARCSELLQAAGFDWRYEEIDPDVFGEELDEPAYRGADRIAAVWLDARRPA